MDFFGDNEATHLVLVLNLHTVSMYWILGAILFGMQKLKYPKSLANFKIQAKESEIEKGENLSQVRPCKGVQRSFKNKFPYFIGDQCRIQKPNYFIPSYIFRILLSRQWA